MAFAQGSVIIKNGSGRQVVLTPQPGGKTCFCIKNSAVASMEARNAVGLKLFATDDCIGQYTSGPVNGIINGVRGILSFSIGPSGLPAPPPTCPNYFLTIPQ
ncbi:hypothetical protein DFQ26_004851 [Actinomortierella ambigua]|nr:hypothetical protein DFQ26_004851 [Actinomortierella ambigua]